uniref:Uncharacterized protein n=1 Tax=Anopheles merus TaxID=30066 RepID=A0A182UPU9_ANOME
MEPMLSPGHANTIEPSSDLRTLFLYTPNNFGALTDNGREDDNSQHDCRRDHTYQIDCRLAGEYIILPGRQHVPRIDRPIAVEFGRTVCTGGGGRTVIEQKTVGTVPQGHQLVLLEQVGQGQGKACRGGPPGQQGCVGRERRALDSSDWVRLCTVSPWAVGRVASDVKPSKGAVVAVPYGDDKAVERPPSSVDRASSSVTVDDASDDS